MAESPSHRLGQRLGLMLEQATEYHLTKICSDLGLYLDRIGYRGTRRGTKITWSDTLGNNHDLDFVIERGGTDDVIGEPIAIIECAWRSYKKHSKNKVQEIQSAVIPVALAQENKPFVGVVLAGEFTSSSIVQLQSFGFAVCMLTEAMQKAFFDNGIDMSFDESTDRLWFSNINKILDSDITWNNIVKSLTIRMEDHFNEFKETLVKSLTKAPRTASIKTVYDVCVEYTDGSVEHKEFSTEDEAVLFQNTIANGVCKSS